MTPDSSALDFWLGEWDVRDPDGGTGHNSIRRILGDRVVEERFSFTAADGQTLTGRSHSVPVADRGWCQTWVDDQGSYLDFTGSHEPVAGDTCLVFARPGQRMVFTDVTADRLRWLWQRAEDDGWRTVWQLDYRRS